MDINRTLPGTIKLVDPNGKVIEQLVQYDWKPQYYQTCYQIGHSCHNKKVQKQEMGQQTYGMQNQGKIWKVEEQWQLEKGKSATKNNGDGRDEMAVNTGNAFTALVDTAQRGMNKVFKQKKLKNFIRENKVVLIAVLENRVKETKAEGIIKKIFNNWRWIENYSQAPGGRIWIAWDQTRVDFEGYEMHQQYIIGEVIERQNGNKFRFGTVYGMHTVQDRKRLWEDMEKAMAGATDPCVLMGDYNTILTNKDRAQGTPVQEFEVKDFKDFIWRNGLTELKTVGRKYT
ncbi:uncharacterized protein LOC107826925 [Nicotiana tabacum]|uniref:Uncharacterized protein LOC107826925 n=1 Tax=Nicotiana tabacum TaxID=4097 RepID=A0A1S4D7P1_TOBAC|nr:PREDICTED: uncharacterized protein LOC107826925 [Nicotiana tabacum]